MVETGAEVDPDWSHYLELLYPSPEEYQRIKNLHTVEALERNGDSLTKPRLVSHWAYFASRYDRSKYISKAVSLGFKVNCESQDDNPEDEHPYGVTLERVDNVDWNSINAATIELFRLAQEVNGYYDGWETSVERNDG